jgi:PIN domain nuclease of toxin-antitoxin system
MAVGKAPEIIQLDTHIWVWSVFKNKRLDPAFADLIDQYPERIAISVISCWEIAMLAAKGRVDLGNDTAKWFENVVSESGIRVLSLTPEITADAYALPGKFHDDPADRVIVATARKHGCLLLTEDSKILKYPHVRTK